MTANEHEVSFWGDTDVIKLDCDGGYTSVNILKTTELYLLNEKMCVCEFYLNKATEINT